MAYSAPPYSAGGVATAQYNLFRALRRAGYDARLFTFGDYGRKDTREIIRRGTPGWVSMLVGVVNQMVFSALDFGKAAYQVRDILASLWGARQMSKAISAFLPDVIVLSDHGAPGLLLKKPLGTKIILVSHHNPARFVGQGYLSIFSRPDSHWAVRLEQRALNKVDVVVCPSIYMRTWFEKTYRFFGRKLVINNILDLRTLASIHPSKLRARMGLQNDGILIYMPSVGERLKGSDYAPKIISRLIKVSQKKLAFYISGNLPDYLIEEFRALQKLTPIYWGGQLPYTENIANLKVCSFGIAPSLIENYSMALFEAVQSGVPMLAFKTGGNPEIISEGENGYLVPRGDVHALIAKTLHLFEGKNLAALRKTTKKWGKKIKLPEPIDAYISLINSL